MKAVGEFLLATGHGCLDRHLHPIKAFIDVCCMLCNLRQPMDCIHLMCCPSLCSKSIWECYWEARYRVGR
ncbi:hypothetical protein TNCT_576481 [Trichonephila clavata]|uniref:Uncharacterized protein n=1 Tax=Trichonephila clavata TaxID=2740835 RepID=A0A8X6H439_TRICU|nr:hypothetical protein TNCT_576481 [Trichonephila clavata]